MWPSIEILVPKQLATLNVVVKPSNFVEMSIPDGYEEAHYHLYLISLTWLDHYIQ